jgi:DNA-binding NtrC family response regulator
MAKKLLVVDDEVAFLLALKKLLVEPGIEVDTAETMEDSMFLIEQNAYDAVIADIRLTGVQRKEGLAILDRVKGGGGGTKVIMMTGFGNPDTMQEAYSLGADYYFEKPVSVTVLKGALQKLGIISQ